jgi:hypothetical protein
MDTLQRLTAEREKLRAERAGVRAKIAEYWPQADWFRICQSPNLLVAYKAGIRQKEEVK